MSLPVVPTPAAPSGPPVSAIAAASAAALASLAANGTAAPAAPAGDPGLPRAENGEWRSPDTHGVHQLPTPSALNPAAPAPEAGLAAPAPDPAAPAPAGDPAAPEAAAGQETPAPAGAPADEAATLVVPLPPRNDGEEDFEIVVDSPEAAERLRQLRNGFLRGEEVRAERAELQQYAQQLEEQQAMASADPVGFLASLVRDPQALGRTALAILTQPEVYRAVANQLDDLTDPQGLRTLSAELRAWRSEHRDATREQLQTRRVVEENRRDVLAALDALVPASYDAAQASLLADVLRNDLVAYATQHNLLTLPVEHIPAILANRLGAVGINPVEAATRLRGIGSRRGGARGAAGPAQPPARAAAAPAAPNPAGAPPRNGRQFVASSVRRDAAAATPPAGAGAPTLGGANTPPRNADGTPMSIQQTLAWHREQHAKGSRIGG